MTSELGATPMSSGRAVGIGVIGGRSFVAERAVLPAIAASPHTHLAAIAARSGPVDAAWSDAEVGSYRAVLEHDEVDAVYIPLPNGMHEEWVVRAAAGKHVLCEKPLAPTVAAARRMASACSDARVLLAEAWMTPFGARWQRVTDTIEAGEIGVADRIDAAFTFTIAADQSANYRWRPEQGGGALLDVGIYALGLPVQLWGAEPTTITVHERLTAETGVDARIDAELTWPGGQHAHIVCSFVDEEAQRLSIAGTTGTITVSSEAFTGGEAARRFDVANSGSHVVDGPGSDPYLGMVDAFALAVAGDAPWPRPVDECVAMLALLERIGAAV